MEREIQNIQETLKRIEGKVDTINGHVRQHGEELYQQAAHAPIGDKR